MLESQSIKNERINYLIKELTPSYSLKENFRNVDIIGYDILNENKERIRAAKFDFYTQNKIYVILYGKRKITGTIAPEENKFPRCKALLEHQDGGYFWSTNTSYVVGTQEKQDFSEEWKIGGIYKIQFAFKVPKYALPGKYRLRIMDEKAGRSDSGRLISFDKIKIFIKRPKAHKKEIFKDYDLSLDGCLLNPAVKRRKQIDFYWTGNIEFYINEDLRNFKKIIISARGTPALGIYPLLKIYADKREIAHFNVKGEWSEYELDLRLDKENHILKVRFDNDGGGPGEDRNMYVRMVKLVR